MTGPPAHRVVRHRLPDRIYHWTMAVCVLVLLFTGLAPIFGLKFGWVLPHWVAGLVLSVAVLFHIVRALLWLEPRSMLLGPRDVSGAWRAVRHEIGSGPPPPRPGKYELPQKLYHHAAAVVVLAGSITGVMMLAKIDAPWWRRNPYWLSDESWGIVYVVHDLAAFCLITLVMIHVYVGLRSDKRRFLRSMVHGWISREDFDRHHDPQQWQVDVPAGSAVTRPPPASPADD